MCGISGFFLGKDNKIPEYDLNGRLKKMSTAINHRGPDNYNTWIDKKDNIYFAHNRLKIIDLSPAGNQPMISYSGKYVIIYNGEIYNHKYIKKKIKTESNNKVLFKNKTDTEILINAIDFWGLKKTLNEIRGMYSFALWDRENKNLTLCRDIFGEKPLYYYFYDGGIYFSSEIKSFKNLDNSLNKISKKNFKYFEYYGYNLNNNTIFEDIKKLPAGTFINFNAQNISTQKYEIIRYWDGYGEANKSLKKLNHNNLEDICENAETLIEKVVEQQLVADVKTGVFLSGGIDSSLVAALSQKLSSKKISTFSIGFDVKDYDESQNARKVAKTLDTNHNEYIMTSSDLVDIIEQKCLLDEPFYDISQYPTYLLTKFASKDVKVCLSGDGGDEIFGGYNRYLISQNKILQLQKFIKFLRLQNFSKKIIDHRFFIILLKKFGFVQIENKIDKIRALISHTSEEDLYEKILRVENVSSFESFLKYKKISNIADNFMINDTNIYLPNNILYKVDSLSMLNSLEVRAPYLDKEIFNFAWSIPQNKKFYKKKSKYILKHIVSKYIPEEIISKPKMGFDIPLFVWIKNTPKLENLIRELYFSSNEITNGLINDKKNEFFEINIKNYLYIWKIALINKWSLENN